MVTKIDSNPMVEWMQKNNSMYPSILDRELMAAEAKLNIKQINTWFCNYRRRRTKKRGQRKGKNHKKKEAKTSKVDIDIDIETVAQQLLKLFNSK